MPRLSRTAWPSALPYGIEPRNDGIGSYVTSAALDSTPANLRDLGRSSAPRRRYSSVGCQVRDLGIVISGEASSRQRGADLAVTRYDPSDILRRKELDAPCSHRIGRHSGSIYDVVPLGGPTNGAVTVEALLGQLFTAFPDFHAAPGRYHHSEDIVVVEARLTGTHRGEWAGVPAPGRAIDLRCCSLCFTSNPTVSHGRPFTLITPHCWPRLESEG